VKAGLVFARQFKSAVSFALKALFEIDDRMRSPPAAPVDQGAGGEFSASLQKRPSMRYAMADPLQGECQIRPCKAKNPQLAEPGVFPIKA
jgi:hypothetical protein